MGLDDQRQLRPLCAEGVVGRRVTGVEKRKSAIPTGFETLILQPIASRCPDYAIIFV